MVHQKSIVFSMCVAAVLAISAAAHAEPVRNPEYARWEKFKPGAYSKLKGMAGTLGHLMLTTQTTTLLELRDATAVIETRNTMEADGRTMDTPPIRREIKAMVEPDELMLPPGIKDKDATVTRSQDKVTIGEKTYDCELAEVVMDKSGAKVVIKIWYSPEVPGGQLKVSRVTDGVSKSPDSTLTLIDMKTGS